MNVIGITVGQIRKAVKLLIAAQKHMPDGKSFGAMVWGQSGLGKNAVTDNLHIELSAKTKQEWGFIDVNLASISPEDFTGLPFLKDGVAGFAPLIHMPSEPFGILRADEMDRPAHKENIEAFIKFAIDKTAVQSLPKNWFVLGLGNGVSDTNTQALSEHIVGRFCHLYITTNTPTASDELSAYWNSRDTHSAIKEFSKLTPMKTRDEYEEHAVYNNRTLEFAACILTASDDLKRAGVNTDDVLLPCLAGVIGKRNAIELLRLCELGSLPNVHDVCATPKTIPLVADLSLRHKYLRYLVDAASTDCTNAVKLMDYLVRYPAEGARYNIDSLVLSCPACAKSATYTIWHSRLG